MSVLDSFFNKGFKAAKCKTLLKLTIPRIKLLRNRREIQIKQMRRDIAKLLETGQEATARIRVEHIIREENMMAAQEILELFCELITVRLPIIESQRECPLDLKEAIASVCFAAPRCSDLPELLQVHILFASKYGKEFVSAATELVPDCGVNRQLIELLSVRAPSPDKKLKLLKEIAEEHEVDWDPAASGTEFFKSHEDLLNGPEFVCGSKVPLPKEKHDEVSKIASNQGHQEEPDSDIDLDSLEFPEVPKVLLRPGENTASAPAIIPPPPHPKIDHDPLKHSASFGKSSDEPHFEPVKVMDETLTSNKEEKPHASVGGVEEKQFLPFISPPSLSSASFSVRQSNNTPPPPSRTKSAANVDLQDVLAAAQAAAETAERAAAAARSAASLAQVRINELTKKNNDQVPEHSSENPFHTGSPNHSDTTEKPHFDCHNSIDDTDGIASLPEIHQVHESAHRSDSSNFPPVDSLKADFDAALPVPRSDPARHQPQRLPSMDDDSYFSYPNLFRSHSSNLGSHAQSSTDNSRSSDER
ncbi:Vacuolar protein sorting-associated protein [Parasponia andersonii]|uniref:Vacuolar protein sorting-associated protein n=1 Tax=Parasponia andersonii TaxID=3476 RepID=A0A2P5BAR4_PARAD|nr:Vacuolar protein sorting-associated protein [Parasponia andersonii]